MVPAVIVPDRTSVLQLLDRFRSEGIHMAVMVDEYGTTEGIATLTAVLESIAGDLPERGELTEPLIDRRSAGAWPAAGTPPTNDVNGHLSCHRTTARRGKTEIIQGTHRLGSV